LNIIFHGSYEYFLTQTYCISLMLYWNILARYYGMFFCFLHLRRLTLQSNVFIPVVMIIVYVYDNLKVPRGNN
jgi:hypothetical protein